MVTLDYDARLGKIFLRAVSTLTEAAQNLSQSHCISFILT